jgi:amidophosphoribosyltransferase
MPNQDELVATGRTESEIAHSIAADLLIYQDLEALKTAVRTTNPQLKEFEASCFDGRYITGDVTADYLSQLAFARDASRGDEDADSADASESVAVSD